MAVAAVLRAESHDDRRRGAAVLCRTLLTVLATDPPPAAADLDNAVHEIFHYVDHGEVGAVYEAFRRSVMPIDAGTELLGEIGAVDGHGRITTLGHWLRERLVAEMPPPVTPDLSAEELLGRLTALPDDEVWRQSGRWLAERDPVKAADELLAAAAGAGPAERVVAVEVVAGLGEPAMPAWQRAIDDPMLAPHARILLGGLQNQGDDEAAPEPDAVDRRWLAVEYALAALATDGPEEAYHLLRDLDGLDPLAGNGHPGAATLRDALADLVRTGGPRVPLYQVKVTLTRVRPPVWRRIRLPATTTLDALHRIIQVAFDWDDDHLHVFTADGRRYADPFFDLDDCVDESRVRLGRLLPRCGGSMRYVYDLGDWWEHQITVERIIDTDAADETPTCVDGLGDAPVEDWFPDCGRDPTPFDLGEINRRLAGHSDVL